MIKNQVEEIEEIYDELKKKYEDTGVVLNILNFAVSARNANHMNANVSGSFTMKEDSKE